MLEFDEDDVLLGHECPECGSDVYRRSACQTFPSQREGGPLTWMACLDCDSAVRYACGRCGWSYTNGLNPRNPRSAANEAKKPGWMPPPEEDPWLKPAVTAPNSRAREDTAKRVIVRRPR